MLNLPNAKVMQTFEVTARLGSFTLASRELYLTQSAISRQIKALEEVLEFPLFVRDNNRLILTERGRIFYDVVSKSLNEIFSTVDKLRQKKERRSLNVLTPPTFTSRWLAPRLQEFIRTCPVSISFNHHQDLSYSPLGDYDCQVAFGRNALHSMGGTLLFQEAMVPACSPAMKKRIERQGNIEGIAMLHTLFEGKRLPYWEIWFEANQDSILLSRGNQQTADIEFSTQNQTIIAAMAGLGIAMIDLNITADVILNEELVLLGEPRETYYGYWVFPATVKYAEDDPANLLYNWLIKKSTMCKLY